MRPRAGAIGLVCLLLAVLALAPASASAFRASLKHSSPEGREEWIGDGELAKLPASTSGQIEGACGVAVSPASGNLFVADYYHRAVHQFSAAGTYGGSQLLSGGTPPSPINEQNAICGLAVDAAGNRYGEELHQSVVSLPGEEAIDPGPATGVAVDSSGNLYVDDRTYVAVYEAPVAAGDEPVEKIGLGSLVDAYGVAVDSQAGRVYVADAFDQSVKAFEPSVDLDSPVATIDGPTGQGFHSLAGAALAVDESATDGAGHLLVVDDLEPLTARPQAAVYEFDEEGEFLDRLTTRKVGPPGEIPKLIGPIFGEPSGIAVDPDSGDVYVTTGNSENSNLLAYGPYQGLAPATLVEGEGGSSAGGAAMAAGAAGSGSAAAAGAPASDSTVVQRHGIRVSFDGKLTPKALPRHGMAPVRIVVDAKIAATAGEEPPQLRRISIAINRNGRFTSRGLPVCRLHDIQPSTTSGALAACRSSLVGEGRFSANVKLPEQSPFPSAGKILAFNGRVHGKPAILAHIYGTRPIPTSIVLPFLIGNSSGTYGTTLSASLPQATGSWGYVTGLRMSLRRRFSYRGHSHSYLSAGCPAPAGFPGAAFPLARTRFSFAGPLTLVSVLNRSCRAKG